MSFNTTSQKVKSSQTSDQKPYEPTIAPINNLISAIPTYTGPSATETGAIGALGDNAAKGDPYSASIDGLAKSLYSTPSQAGTVSDGYQALQGRLNPIADGQNQSLTENPYIAHMLSVTADNAANAVKGQFASAGRDLSGYSQEATAKGISDAQLPILANQFNQQQGRTDAATRTLYDASGATAQGVAGLNTQAQTQQQRGIDVGNAAIAAGNYGPEQALNVEAQRRNLPYDSLDKMANILYPAAQLGRKTTATGTSKGRSTGFSLSLKDLISPTPAPGGG